MCNLNPTLYIYIYIEREREREREREDVVWCSFVGFSYHKTAHCGAVLWGFHIIKPHIAVQCDYSILQGVLVDLIVVL